MEKDSSERVKWIDACKGFATVVVVLGHVVDGYRHMEMQELNSLYLERLYNVIYSFHMALFFVLSGLVFSIAYYEKKKWINAKRQIINMIYCYYIFSIGIWVTKFYFIKAVNNPVSLNDLFLIPVVPISPYWYLMDLIVYYCAFVFLFKNLEGKRIGCLFMGMLIMSFASKLIISDDNNIHNLLFYAFFFYIGIIYQKLVFLINKKIIRITSIAISCVSLISIIFFDFNIRRIPVISTVCALAFSMCIMHFFTIIEGNKSQLYMLLTKCGKYALEVYLIHCYITALSRKILSQIGFSNIFVCIVLSVIIGITIPISVSKLLRRLGLYNFFFRPFSKRQIDNYMMGNK